MEERKWQWLYNGMEFNYMTDEERAIFEYQLAVNGQEAAQKYLAGIKESLSYRHGKDISGDVSKFGPLGEVFYMGYAGLDNWAQGVQSSFEALTGQGGKKATTATQYAAGITRENLGDRGKLWQVGGDVMQILGNMAPSLLLGSINPLAGYATTLVGAGGNGYQEAINMGYSDGQAKFYGVLTGASEVLLEKLLNGVGNFGGELSNHAMEKLISNIHNANLRVAAKVGGQMASEFTEEYLQEILTPVYQNIALGTDNDFELFTEEALYAGILGAISSGVFQGAEYIGNKVLNRNNPPVVTTQQPESPANVTAAPQSSAESGTDPLMELAKQTAERQEAQQAAEIPVLETATARAENPARTATAAQEAALADEDAAVIKAYRAYYDAGYSNTPREKVTVSSTALTEAQKAAAWEDGQKVRNSFEKGKTTSFVKQGETGAVVENPAALDFGKHNGKLLKSLKQFAKNWGVKIVIGNYGDHINGSIKDGVIRLNAEKFTGKTKSQVLAKVLAHEITHRMQETAPEAYARYRDAALQHQASLVGGSLDSVIRGYQNRQVAAREKAVADARANNPDITPEQIAAIEADYPDLSREDAMDEIAADYTKKFIADTEAFREFIGKSKEHRSLGRKLIDCAKAIVAKIKATFSSQKARNAASQEAFGKDLAAAEKALKLWEEAYAEGQKAVKNAPVRESTGESVSKYSLFSTPEILSIRGIGDKSISQFTSAEIHKTEKFAQRLWKEMGVKSPFFRAWFGDWRAYDQTAVQIATQKGNSRGKQKNIDTGWEISVSGKVFNETKVHTDSSNKAARPYLGYISDIVQKAVLLDSYTIPESEAKSPNSLLMHSLYAVADIGNGPEVLKLYVEEMNDPNSSDTAKRAYQLQNVEKYRLLHRVHSNSASSVSAGSGVNTVADLFAAVKARDAKFKYNSVNPVLLNADGTPKKFYHGTPNGDFSVFNEWQYFTENKEYADLYQGQGASSNGYKKTARNRKTYETYLAPKKIFDTRTPADRKIFEDEFYGKWGNGAPLSEKGLPDWTDGDDLTEFFAENGYDYDAILLDEGATGGYGEEVISRGISIVVRDSTAIKSATDNIGTFDRSNPDIHYSLSGDDILAEAEEQAAAERETMDRLEYLRKQVAVTKKTTADPKAVDKLAKDTIRSWGADMETEDIVGDLQLAMDAALRMDAKTDVETVYNQFVDIGRKIAENMVEVDGDIYREYSELRKELRDYHIYVGPEIVADIADYFDTVRPYRNRLKLTTRESEGTVTIDQAFHDLTDAYPWLFSEDNQIS